MLMATTSSDNTLLALLLALKTLKTPLTETEQAKLYEVGEQLELDPDDWEFIREGLIAIIADNPSLNDNFQYILTHLNALDGNQERQEEKRRKGNFGGNLVNFRSAQ